LKNADAVKNGAIVKIRALEAGLNAAEARLRQASLALEEAEIVSPIDGIIAYLNIEEGYYFTQTNIRTTSESDALQTIPIVVIDPSRYEITVDVPAYQADVLSVGQNVLLVPGGMSATAAFGSSRTDAASAVGDSPLNWQAKGTIFSINPAVNPGGRSVQLKIRTSQGAERLKDGMFVACWIEVQSKADAIVAPFDAFLFEENRPYVFVVDSAGDSADRIGKARRVDVRPGIESLTTREIVGGVKDGELLVTDGRYRLVDGAPVRLINGGNKPHAATSPPTTTRTE
jgi:RND family efflux transporter MFP subunit